MNEGTGKIKEDPSDNHRYECSVHGKEKFVGPLPLLGVWTAFGFAALICGIRGERKGRDEIVS